MTVWAKQNSKLLIALGWVVWLSGCVGSETVLEIQPSSGGETDLAPDTNDTAGDSEEGNHIAEEDIQGCGTSVWEISELDITDPHLLASLTGVTHFRGDLTIHNLTASVEDMRPLHSLRCVDGDFYLHSIQGLTNLTALSSLISVGGDFVIQLNDNLADMDDLTHLNNVGGDLVIQGNDALNSLVGVQDIRSLGGNNLYILYNANLPNCAAMGIYNSVSEQGWQGDACIFENFVDGCENLRQGCSDRFYWRP